MEELRKALAVKNLEVAEKDAEIARLQKRCALLDSLLGECIRHHYLRRCRGFADLAGRSSQGRNAMKTPARAPVSRSDFLTDQKSVIRFLQKDRLG
jgi:hypothetical protein